MKLTMGMLLTNLRRNIGSGPTLATLPVTPTARWNADFSSVVTSGGRVTSISDLQGLAAATEGAVGIGPYALTDLVGRKFWRFEGAEYLNVATSLVNNLRDISVFCVARIHRSSAAFTVYSAGLNGSTAVNANGATFATAISAQAGHWWSAHAASGGSIVGKEADLQTDSQLQVAGMCSRSTALGGRRLMVNSNGGNTTQNSTATTGVNGAEIGRYSFSPGASGNWATMDLYEMVVYSPALSDIQADAVMAALQSNYGIITKTNQIVLEGDSITQGTGTVTSGISSAMILSEPGANRIPNTWRVMNRGVSGAKIADLVTRRDVASGWPNWLASGQNVLAFEIGRNDWSTFTETDEYNAVVAYLNITTTGILQRGWTVRVMAPIAAAATFQAKIVPYRALLRNAQFLTDTQSNSGGAFDGKVSIVSTDLIQLGGQTIFEDSADASNVTYYQGDSTHPTPVAAVARVTGGDTPQYGIAYGLT